MRRRPNDGSYGKCPPGCVLDPRCGDGVVQEDAGEACDDGNLTNYDTCNVNCKNEIVLLRAGSCTRVRRSMRRRLAYRHTDYRSLSAPTKPKARHERVVVAHLIRPLGIQMHHVKPLQHRARAGRRHHVVERL